MKKGIILAVIALVVGGGVILAKKMQNKPAATQEEEQVDLPINTIPVEERPFITLTPDMSGRNLNFHVAGAPTSGLLEYEMVYNTVETQEGVFGRLDLENEKQPVEKELLLGSKSGGGKITYHEGITGGSMTVTYGETRLKEQFNFLRFDPTDPLLLASDGRFSVTIPKTSLKKDNVVVVMKSFGLPAKLEGKLVVGPYAYLPPTPIKGDVTVEMKLPAGTYENAAIHTFVDGIWRELKTSIKDNETLTATTSIGTVFAVATK